MNLLRRGLKASLGKTKEIQLLRLLVLLLVPFIAASACRLGRSSYESSSAELTSGEVFVELASEEPRTIPKGLMCFNVNAIRVKSWQNPSFISAIQTLSPDVLRIPGGEVANYWDWKRGGLIQDPSILPDGLPFFLNSKDIQKTKNSLGDFQFAFDATDTTPLFVLNMLSSTLDSQLEMLQQAENLGIPVQEVELGNEFYFGKKNNKTIFPNPEDYARIASKWAKEIRKEFPNVKISVVGIENQGVEDFRKLKPRRKDWNDLVLPSTLKDADAATFHIYAKTGLEGLPSNNLEYPSFENEDVSIILGEPFRYWDTLKQSNEFKTVPTDKEIWITEYNLFEKNQKSGDIKPRVVGSWAHGLYTLAMSLLFLEDPRVDKICNHVLVGNSQFAAVFADDKSFVNPLGGTTQSVPNGLSATGSTLKLLGQSLNGATSAQKLEFTEKNTLEGKLKFKYPALYGWIFLNGENQKQALITNFSDSSQTSNLSSIFPQEFTFEQVSAPPKTLVSNTNVLDANSGRTSNSLVLPPYSVTLVSDKNN